MDKCQLCFNLQPDTLSYLKEGQRATVFIFLGELQAAIARPSPPCLECQMIWRVLSSFKSDRNEDDLKCSVELGIAAGKPLHLFWRSDKLYLELFLPSKIRQNTTLPATIGRAVEVPEISSSDACFHHATSWLETCVNSHSLCRQKAPCPLPTRVINVGDSEGQEPYLCESGSRNGQYIALSYCWGDPKTDDVLKTTTGTLEKHKHAIDFAALPQTLKDALVIARRLNIQYIWIDALCIIQDDADDWARESSKMCEVYSNAHLTIACDNSSGSSHGIFHKQSYSAAIEISYKGVVIAARKHLARDHNNYMTLMRETNGEEVPEPINCRAWTFQEAILSNRILHYTSKELTWECNEWRFCECEHGSGRIEAGDDITNRFLRRPGLFGEQGLAEIHSRWNDLVQLFSMREIGYEEDELPAFSGLANAFSRILKFKTELGHPDQYLAGIWQSNLAKSLLWSISEDHYLEGRNPMLIKTDYLKTKEWRAPSWSWASVKGPVELAPQQGLKQALKFIEASCTPATVDPYGKVKSVKLVVRAKMIHDVTVVVKSFPGPAEQVWNFGVTQGKRHYVQYGSKLLPFMCDYAGVDWSSDVSSHSKEAEGKYFSILLVGRVTTSELTATKEEFLVLRKAAQQPEMSDDGLDVYERIGLSTRTVYYLDGYSHQSEVLEELEIFKTAREEIVSLV